VKAGIEVHAFTESIKLVMFSNCEFNKFLIVLYI